MGLSELGQQVASAERGEEPPLPIGLILGDSYAGGLRPPFDAARTVAALHALAESVAVSDNELLGIVGPPAYPNGCQVDGDVDRLLNGSQVTLRLSARFDWVGPATIEVSGFPHLDDVDPEDVLSQQVPTGVRVLRNMSRGNDLRYAAALSPEADVDAIIAEWAQRGPMQVEVSLSLGSPWRALASGYLASVAGVDLAEHLRLIAAP